MLWAYRTCIGRRDPVAVREQVQFSQKEWVTIEALLLPIGATDDRVDMVLSGVDTAGPDVELPAHGVTYILEWQRG